MDLSTTIAPKSDQLNADDLIAGPMTVTVDRVSHGEAEQPVDIHTVETPGRAYRPSKSMRRVLIAAWGKDGDKYAGRRITLYRDPDVKFGKDLTGGIKISHLSHIERPMSLALTVTRGKRSPHTVQPLPDASAASKPAPVPTAEQVAECTDLDALRAMWQAAKPDPERQAQITARVAELSQPESLVLP